MLSLSGHLGDRTAALVDGQLTADQEERAWQHVLGCPGCRQAVEQQVAAKQVLGSLRDHPESPGPRCGLGPEVMAAWTQVAEVERVARRRQVVTGGVVGGALTASLALGLVATGALDPGEELTLRPSPATVGGQLVRPDTWTDTAAGSGRDRSRNPGWVGTGTGAETSRAMWRDGTRW